MKKIYKTDDIALAASILSLTHTHLLFVDLSDGEPEFAFYRDDVSDEFVAMYTDGKLMIEPFVFSLVFRFLLHKVDERKSKSN